MLFGRGCSLLLNLLTQILTGLSERDTAKALEAVHTASTQNMDARVLMKLLMHHVRAVLLLRYVPSLEKEFKEELGDAYDTVFAFSKEATITSDTLRALLAAYTTMTYAALPYAPLELAIVDLTAPVQG